MSKNDRISYKVLKFHRLQFPCGCWVMEQIPHRYRAGKDYCVALYCAIQAQLQTKPFFGIFSFYFDFCENDSQPHVHSGVI